MLGILCYLRFALKVHRELENVISIDKVVFYSKKTIPDLAIDKLKLHYKKEVSLKGFYVPDLKRVKKILDY